MALLLGAVSPGPSFVFVSRTALATNRRGGLAAAAGMGAGGAVFAVLALAGLVALLRQVDWLYLTLKIVGGGYLLIMATKMWRNAGRTASGRSGSGSSRRPFLLGAVTQVSNPKTAVVYGSIFAALVPAEPPMWLLLVLPAVVFIVETGWYGAVASLLSSSRPRAWHHRQQRSIDRVAGALLGALGAVLLSETLT